MFKKLTATPKNNRASAAWGQADSQATTAQLLDLPYEQVNQGKRVPVGWIG